MTTIASPASAHALSPQRRWAVLAAAILDLLDSTISLLAVGGAILFSCILCD